MNDRQPNIAVIGPSHSGKTCLAVGLYCTSRPDLAIVTPNDADREYLKSRTVELGNPDWPHATLSERADPIAFDFVRHGQSVRVPFLEYPGEIMADDEKFTEFANAHWRNLDGVVLLVNPGAPAFQAGDTDLYEDTVSQYEKLIDFLGSSNNNDRLSKPFVALTVTAADRLEGDLKGKLKSFEECLENLANLLANKDFEWKRFDVTVTGPLNDQNKPSIAEPTVISVAEPFLWLVKRIRVNPVPWKLFGGLLLACILLVLLVWGGCKIMTQESAAKWRKTLDLCVGKDAPSGTEFVPSTNDLTNAAATLVVFREKAPQEAKRWLEEAGSKLEEGFQKRLERDIENLSASNNASITMLFDEWFRVDEWVRASPECSTNYVRLKRKWKEKEYDLKLKSAVTDCQDTVQSLKSLAELSLQQTVTDEFLTLEFVQERWEQDCRRFYDSAYSDYLDQLYHDILDGKKEFKEAENQIWKDDMKIGAPFNASNAVAGLKGMIGRQDFENRQACEEWVRRNVRTDRERRALFDDYKNARTGELKNNQYFNEIVQAKVYQQFGEWLKEDIACFSDNASLEKCRSLFETRFDDFQRACCDIVGDPKADKASWVYQFARLCKEKGKVEEGKDMFAAFPQTLTITHIDCKVNYKVNYLGSAPEKTTLDVTLEANAKEESILGAPVKIPGEVKTWTNVWTGHFHQEAGLLMPMILRVKVDKACLLEKHICGLQGDWFEGETFRQFFPPLKSGGWFGIRIYGTMTNMTPHTLLEEALEKSKEFATKKEP